MIATILLVCLVGAATPLTEDRDFIAAKELYQQLEFERAIFRLQDAALDSTRNDIERAEIFVWMGVNYAQIGDEENARRSFLHAARRNSDVGLPVSVSPTVSEWFEESKNAADRERAERRVAIDPDAPQQELEMPTTVGPPAVEGDGALTVPMLAAGAGAAGAAGLSLMGLAGAGYLFFVAYTQVLLFEDDSYSQKDAQGQETTANAALYGGAAAMFAAVVSAAAAATLVVVGTTFLNDE